MLLAEGILAVNRFLPPSHRSLLRLVQVLPHRFQVLEVEELVAVVEPEVAVVEAVAARVNIIMLSIIF